MRTPRHTNGHQPLVVRRADAVVVVAGESHDTASAYSVDDLVLRGARRGAPGTRPLPAPWMAPLQALDSRYVVFAHDHSVWVP